MRIEVDTKKLDVLTPKVKRNIATALNWGALAHSTRAKILAPVDTGALRNSIIPFKQATAQSLIATSETGIEYAVYQEFGTRYMPPQPFMLPAFVQTKQDVINRLKKVIDG